MNNKHSSQTSVANHLISFILRECLTLITGAALGATIALSLSYKDATDFWGMVGSLLAGLGTVGLLWFAMKSASSWRNEFHSKGKREALTRWYLEAINYNRMLEDDFIQSIYRYQMNKDTYDEEMGRFRTTKKQIENSESNGEDTSALKITLSNIEKNLPEIEDSYQKSLEDYHASYRSIKITERYLEDVESIFTAYLTNSNDVDEVNQLRTYFTIDGKTLSRYQIKSHVTYLNEKVSNNKNKIKSFYNKTILEFSLS